MSRNRAKCRLCNDVIESKHRHDFVTCKCGEISVDGGDDYWRCGAKDFDNFIRLDDDGNEIKTDFEKISIFKKIVTYILRGKGHV